MERKNAFRPLIILILALAGPAQAQYAGGSGEPSDPYLITTPEQMNAIGANPNDWDKHFKLMADIDLAQYTGTEFNIIGSRRISGRGGATTRRGPFTGLFDGNGHTIANFTWRSDDTRDVGLFGCVDDPNAEIKSLRTVDPNVSGQSSVGALVGYLCAGAITDCSVQGGAVSATDDVGGLVGCSERPVTIIHCCALDNVVSGQRSVGGLLGCSNATVTDCHTRSSVSGDNCVGGLVGWQGNTSPGGNLRDNGAMTQCRSSSVVIGKDAVGGLAGGSFTVVTSCHASGSVTGDASVGGLVGSSSGAITDSYATGNVLGARDVGGLLGYAWEGYKSENRIEKCHASGDVSGDDCAGGLIGMAMGSRITACYATGEVTGGDDVGGLAGCSGSDGITNCYAMGNVSGGRRVGGLVGHCGSIVNCYSTGTVHGDEDVGGLVGKKRDWDETAEGCFWDVDTSQQSENAGGSAKTTADMYRAATFLGWGGDVWTIDDGNDYPRLWWEEQPGEVIQRVSYPSGSGTADDPFLIYTTEEMAIIGWVPSHWGKHFKLMADINLAAFAGASFCTIGDDSGNAFTGVFDGNGHTISNFTYASLDKGYVGLFGMVYGSGAEIKNLGLIDPHVETGMRCLVGGLVGYLHDGRVASCYVAGGIVSGAIYKMHSVYIGDVVIDSVGALVGYNWRGSILNCYSTTAVAGEGNHYSVGGLVGYNRGTVANSYATGIVTGEHRTGGLLGRGGGATASFWNIEATGQAESYGGTGLTTAEMQDINTYLDAGWDFVDESSNGTADIWQIAEEGGYPELTAFLGYEPILPDGEGTFTEPYLISNALELGSIQYRNGAYYRLDADIDLSAITWTTAVVPSFAGHFDGNGHLIRSLRICGGGHLGLFGCVLADAVVTNVYIEQASIEGRGDYIGALAGRNHGRIVACHSNGSVSGDDYVGGLIGSISHGSVSSSSSRGTVTGNFDVGGLVGYFHSGSVSTTCSTSIVTGDWHVGGLAGYSYPRASFSDCYGTGSAIGCRNVGGLIGYKCGSNISNCYSSGSVAGDEHIGGFSGFGLSEDVWASFWDMETSRQTKSSAGEGLTTSEMQTAATFLEAGWDFVGEAENGTEDIWWIDEGRDYPRLWWEGEF